MSSSASGRSSLEDALLARAKDGRIACAAALAVARSLACRPQEVGEACDRLGLKISDCQLGCFGRRSGGLMRGEGTDAS